MLRLFLGLMVFLSASLGGLWYGFLTDSPLEDATFENAPLVFEEKKVSETVSEPVPQENIPMPVVSEPEPSSTVTVSTQIAEPSADKPAVSNGLSIQSRLLRFGYRVPTSPRTIDTIVLHSSYNALGGDPYSVERTIEEYEQYGVGAHYLIDRSGIIHRLIEEANIAYHAGASKLPDGRKNVNDFSIGIELIATEESGYTDKQYAAVNALIADIKDRQKIKTVVGHMDIAPGRKTDPWKFDWKKLK